MPEPTGRARRSDARENRERILDVARDALSSGDVSLTSITRKARVGPGTLYRHFPNREALVLAVYRREVQLLVEWVPDLLAEQPPLVALRLWVERLAMYARMKHGLGEVLHYVSRHGADEAYAPVVGALVRLLRACEEAGVIREGLDPDDVLVLFGCLWRVAPGEDGRQQAGRLLGLLLDGLRAENEAPVLREPTIVDISVSGINQDIRTK